MEENKMEEMNKQNPENIPEEQTQQVPAQDAAADKRAQKKAQRKAKKAHYKQIRKELRQKQKEAYQARTALGKFCYVSRKILSFLTALVLLITVIRVNYKEISFAALFGQLIYENMSGEYHEVTREDILAVSPLDEERGARIDASAPLEEGETWAIYMYMVGSDLEARHTNQLNDATQYIVNIDAAPLRDERNAQTKEHIKGMVDTIVSNGLDMPNSMYTKKVTTVVDEVLAFKESLKAEFMNTFPEFYSASADIEELTQVTLPENVKVVLQPGGATAWGNNDINPNKTQRFVYDSEGMHKVYESHITNMGNPQTLVDFLTYCEEEHPADHTMVVFWNHGGASFGYGYDSVYLNDFLSLEELRWAFEQVYTLDENNPPVDIIGFDACLMASMEVAEALNGAANYLVASEEVEPGYGWDYTDLMTRIVENPRMNSLQMSRAVADSYMDFYAKSAAEDGTASNELYSVLDLTFADDLYQAYSDFAASALKVSADYAGTAAYLGKSANGSIKFCGADQDGYNTLDLGLFMEGAAELFPEESEAVLKLLDKMVLYNRRGDSYREATGITVYYPAAVKDWYGFYKSVDYIGRVCKDPNTQALYYYKVAGCLPEDMQAYVQEQGYGQILPMNTQALKALQKTNVTVLEDGNMILPMTQEAITITQDFNYHLLQIQEDGTARKLGNSSYLTLSEDNQLQSVFEGCWLQMDGVLLQTEVVSGTPSDLRLRSYVRHNGNYSWLLLSVDLETQVWSVIGIQPETTVSDNTILADRTTTQLEPGDILVPVFEEYDIHTGTGYQMSGEEIVYKEGIKIAEQKLPDGEYMSYISLVDARGDVYDMQVTSFEMNNGTMRNGEIVKMP